MTVGKKEERITGGSMLITCTNLSVINIVIYIMDRCLKQTSKFNNNFASENYYTLSVNSCTLYTSHTDPADHQFNVMNFKQP